jgi:hypothetical protein
MSKSRAIVESNVNLAEYGFPQGIEVAKDVIQSNLGGKKMKASNLDRAVNPSGKSNQWEIPGIGDEPETVSEVDGIIAYHKFTRAYWPDEYGKGDESPVCTSDDGENGVGTPGGNCETCPLAEFTTDEDGERVRPACRYAKQIFLRRPGEMLPVLFTATPVNVNEAERYFTRLSSKGLKFNHVVTKLSLEKARSTSGYDYAKYKLAAIAILDEQAVTESEEYTQLMLPLLQAQGYVEDAVVDAEVVEAEVDEQPKF